MKKIAKAKASTEFGKLSVKAGIDKNPKPTAADKIAGAKMKAAGKAKYGSKIKKAQTGLVEGYDLPEAVVTASRIDEKPAKPSKPGKVKDWTRKVSRVNKDALKRSGAGAGKMTNVLGMRKRYKEGGEVSKAKKGASVKKSSMGKCRMGC